MIFFQILKLGGIANFLMKLMDPPSRDAVLLSIKHLKELVSFFFFLACILTNLFIYNFRVIIENLKNYRMNALFTFEIY